MPLMTTKPMFDVAYDGGFAVGAFNVCNLESVQAVFDACAKEMSPCILQISKGGRKYARYPYLKAIIDAAAAEHPDVPYAIHCDHADSIDLVTTCVRDGYTSVMFDGSRLSFDGNVKLTAQVVEAAHAEGVVVEGELGGSTDAPEPDLLRFDDEMMVITSSRLTDPVQASQFVRKTKVDSLAVAVGTNHGAYASKEEPAISLDHLQKLVEACPGLALVIHGASALPEALVETLGRNGGAAPSFKGLPDEQLAAAAKVRGVCKVNLDTDVRLAFTATLRENLASKPAELDFRAYMGQAREAMTQMIRQKLSLLNSAGQALTVRRRWELNIATAAGEPVMRIA